MAGWLTDLGTLIRELREAPAAGDPRSRVGFLGALVLLPPVGAFAIGSGVSSSVGGDVEAAAQLVALPAIACVWGSALAAPLLASIPYAARGVGIAGALAEGWLRARLGVGAVFGAGLAAAVAAGALFAWLGLVVTVALNNIVGLICGGALAAAVGLLGLALTSSWALRQARRGCSMPRRRLPIATSVVVSVSATVLVALAVSTPMSTPLEWDDARLGPSGGVPEASRVTITRLAGGMEVRGPVGTTVVRWPTLHGEDFPDGGWPSEIRRSPSGSRWYVAAWSPRAAWAAAEFDGDGRRLDDGYGDRLRARFGAEGACGLGIALGLGLLAAWEAWRARRGIARDGALAPARLTLELAPDAKLEVEGDEARPTGEVWLASAEGDRVVTLDRPLPWLGEPAVALERGARLMLVAPVSSEAHLGPRMGAQPAPAGAWLTDGQSDLETSLARHGARASALTTLAAALAAMATAAYALVWL